jgi:hypothetical protein
MCGESTSSPEPRVCCFVPRDPRLKGYSATITDSQITPIWTAAGLSKQDCAAVQNGGYRSPTVEQG